MAVDKTNTGAGKRVTSAFFEQRLERMDAGDQDADALQGLDLEDRSVVFLMRKLHFTHSLKLGDLTPEAQVDCYSRNTRAMVNLVIDAEHCKAPQPITASAEVVIDAIVLQEILNGVTGLPPVAISLLEAIGKRAEEALNYYLDNGMRFIGLPPAICQILEARMAPARAGKGAASEFDPEGPLELGQ
jgi:hypothetical protein